MDETGETGVEERMPVPKEATEEYRALGEKDRMPFVEDLFQFFPTFLCLADWGLEEGDQIREPYYD